MSTLTRRQIKILQLLAEGGMSVPGRKDWHDLEAAGLISGQNVNPWVTRFEIAEAGREALRVRGMPTAPNTITVGVGQSAVVVKSTPCLLCKGFGIVVGDDVVLKKTLYYGSAPLVLRQVAKSADQCPGCGGRGQIPTGQLELTDDTGFQR